MSVWQFPVFTVKGCGTTSANSYRLTIAQMNLSDYSVVWDAPTTALYNPFTDIPELGKSQATMAGALEVKGGTFTCSNMEIESGIRMSTLFTDYNPYDTRWILRIEIHNGAAYEIWMDLMLYHDVDIEMVDADNPDTWIITIDGDDVLMLLEEIPFAAVAAELDHATYDIAPSATVLSWIESATVQSDTLDSIFQNDKAGEDEWVTAANLRYFNIMDVLGGFARAMGLLIDINNGGALDHDWVYNVRSGGADVAKGFEDLCVTSAYYYNLTTYQQYWTFFDADRWADHSLYNCGSALEALKLLLVPHGLTASIESTALGAWYMQVRQLRSNTGHTLTGWRKSAMLSPADRIISGITVQCSNDGMAIRGTTGDGADSIRCPFTSAQRIARGRFKNTESGQRGTDDLLCLHTALWAQVGTVMHNVYSVEVRSHGQTGTSGTITPPEYWGGNSGLLFCEAAAVYYYNPGKESTDAIGLQRPQMRRLEFSVNGINRTAIPGDYVNYLGLQWPIVEVSWPVKGNTTKFICETGAW